MSLKSVNASAADGNSPAQNLNDTAPPVVMTFAASDPTAGAGLQADALTIAAMGAHPVTVVTGLTVQDTTGVTRFEALSGAWVMDQACAVLDDMPVAAFKTGVLGSPEVVEVVASLVSKYPGIPLIVDPVLASGRGDSFGKSDVVAAIRELLLPLTTLITPNVPEAFALSKRRTRITAAKALLALGCDHVLLTGTHDTGTQDVVNELYAGEGLNTHWTYERLPGEFHGSGCTLASACAAALAHGHAMTDAVEMAQVFTWQTLAKGWALGRGQAIPNRLFWVQDL